VSEDSTLVSEQRSAEKKRGRERERERERGDNIYISCKKRAHISANDVDDS